MTFSVLIALLIQMGMINFASDFDQKKYDATNNTYDKQEIIITDDIVL